MWTEYNFTVLSVATLGAYAASLYLVGEGKIKLTSHRRFWNIVLLGSFVLSGPLGALMSFVIDNGLSIPYYATLLWLHVEAGIVMAIAAAIHAIWHWRYYLPARKG